MLRASAAKPLTQGTLKIKEHQMRRIQGMGASLSLRIAARNWWCLILVALVTVQIAGCSGRPFWVKKASTVVALAPGPFLGPADFQGHYSPRPGMTWNGLQSTYSGTVAVTMVNREIVKKMLPPGLFLAEPKPLAGGGTPGTHPVVHLMGDQGEPSTLFWGIPTQVGSGYQEMILIVPFVVRGTGTLWHNYVVRMYLNNQLAVDGGNEFFGYAKELAILSPLQDWGVVHHKVSSPDLATIWFLDDIDVPGQWGAMPGVAATLARWNDISTILEMPFLGLRPADVLQPSGIQRSALLICSYWELQYANASLAATVSRHRVVTKFRDGMEDWETMGTLVSAQDGAVSMRGVRWRLAMPPQGC
ncbi:MAG: hypothetical protein JWQ33_2922 [Ramlibacter sp.]|nr:hypothetical protein [Ramlibacter sp.]